MSGNEFIRGRYTYGEPTVMWGEYHEGKVICGAFCSVDSTSTFILGGNHRADWITTFPFMSLPEEFSTLEYMPDYSTTKGDVTIGNDVWIGRSAVILSGVDIPDGCVIGAFTTVSKSIIEPYSVIVGNPGRVVKKRFFDHQIAALMEICWWDWDIEKIIEAAPLLCSANIDEFIAKYRGNA